MKISYWLAATVTIGVVNYLYHPTVTIMVAGTAIGLALTILVTWSGSRIPGGKLWLLKVLAVSIMAGLMNVTALDVVYSLLAAPEGNRYILPIEMVASGLLLTALVFLRSRLGPKQKD
jgi:hypothetical protein